MVFFFLVWGVFEVVCVCFEFIWMFILVLFGIVLFVFVYLIIIFYLCKYIYCKIKFIYKIIYKYKVLFQEKNKNIDVCENIIDEVEKQVVEWAEQQQEELDKYKVWVEYCCNFVGDIFYEFKMFIFNIQGYLYMLFDGVLEDFNVNIIFFKKVVKNLECLYIIVEDLEVIFCFEFGELMLEI